MKGFLKWLWSSKKNLVSVLVIHIFCGAFLYGISVEPLEEFLRVILILFVSALALTSWLRVALIYKGLK